MQYMLKNTCPRSEFILLKTILNKGLFLQGNMYLHSLSNFFRKRHFNGQSYFHPFILKKVNGFLFAPGLSLL
jgi:hypothetical protein